MEFIGKIPSVFVMSEVFPRWFRRFGGGWP